jgi:hypothetical protein
MTALLLEAGGTGEVVRGAGGAALLPTPLAVVHEISKSSAGTARGCPTPLATG